MLGLKAFDVCIREKDYTTINEIETHRDNRLEDILMPSLSSSVVNLVHNYTSGRKIWFKLKSEIAPGDYANYFRKLNKIKQMRLSEDDDIKQFIERLDELFNNLLDVAPDPTAINNLLKLSTLISIKTLFWHTICAVKRIKNTRNFVNRCWIFINQSVMPLRQKPWQ